MKKFFLCVSLFSLGLSALLIAPAFADGTLDGVAGPAYGSAVATDPILPTAGEGGAGPNGPMDLENLFIFEDAADVFVCLTVATDASVAGTNDWGKYKVFIETNNGGAGLTTDPWGRALGADGVNLDPQYNMSAWVDTGGGNQPFSVQAGAWQDDTATWGGGFAFSGNGNTGGFLGTEWQIPKAWLGNPSTIQVEATATGGGSSDNGQDTVPSDVNATDWATATVLSNPTASQPVPAELSAFNLD